METTSRFPVPCHLFSVYSSENVRFFPGERKNVEFLTRHFFQRKMDVSDFWQLIGAPGALHVQIGTIARQLYLEFYEHDNIGLTGTCLIGIKQGQLSLLNEGCRLLSPCVRACGIGTEWFHRQKKACELYGVEKIDAFALRSSFSNGYYTLPRFGFNAKIPKRFSCLSPDGLDFPKTLCELFQTPSGRSWWKKHGIPMKVSFDLRNESNSQKNWTSYFGECVNCNKFLK